jgi:hypothetical protein
MDALSIIAEADRLTDRATADEREIELAFLNGAPLDPILQRLYQEAVDGDSDPGPSEAPGI